MLKLESNSIFYPLYGLLIVVLLLLNWNNNIMSGILPYYNDFSAYFSSGFSTDFVFTRDNPTFPMWGYGLVFFLTTNKFIIVFLQLAAMVFVIHKWDEYLAEKYSRRGLFRLFILLGACYIMFNVPLWPYSFSCSLISLSILCLLKANDLFSWKPILYSALMLGIAINFRSDYFYFVMVLPLILIFCRLIKVTNIPYKAAVSYYPIIGILILPWMMHANRYTGHYLPTSTNSGHVMYVSLGQMPNNPWGITADDGDPKMKSIVKRELNSSNSLNYSADKVLKEAFLNEVKDKPVYFIKKCLFNLYYTAVRPFSNGDIERSFIADAVQLKALKQNLKKDVKSFNIGSLVSNILNGNYTVFLFSMLLNLLNIVLLLIFFYHIGLVVFKLGIRIFEKFELIILFSIIGYQLTLQTLVFYNPNYHTNVFLFYVTSVIVIRSILKGNESSEPVIQKT